MDGERTPPKRIRVTGLQEAQLPALAELDQACAGMYYEAGFTPAEMPARAIPGFVALTRDHDLRVAEADHEVAGYLAWRDEPPGVAYIESLCVHPDYQRAGVGTRLLESMQESAREHRIAYAAIRVVDRATWATAFLSKQGFKPLGGDAPQKVRDWLERREEPLAIRPGAAVLWSAIPPKAEEPEEDPELDDATPS
jgi:amino-acid N-acetyltransferase